jgi:hypothetical protein
MRKLQSLNSGQFKAEATIFPKKGKIVAKEKV